MPDAVGRMGGNCAPPPWPGRQGLPVQPFPRVREVEATVLNPWLRLHEPYTDAKGQKVREEQAPRSRGPGGGWRAPSLARTVERYFSSWRCGGKSMLATGTARAKVQGRGSAVGVQGRAAWGPHGQNQRRWLRHGVVVGVTADNAFEELCTAPGAQQVLTN